MNTYTWTRWSILCSAILMKLCSENNLMRKLRERDFRESANAKRELRDERPLTEKKFNWESNWKWNCKSITRKFTGNPSRNLIDKLTKTLTLSTSCNATLRLNNNWTLLMFSHIFNLNVFLCLRLIFRLDWDWEEQDEKH